MKKLFDKIGKTSDEYLDTLASFMLFGGSLLSAVSLGVLKNGGTTQGYNFIYLKHPFYFELGLLAMSVGFVFQLLDNLTIKHKLPEKKAYKFIAVVFIYLIIY